MKSQRALVEAEQLPWPGTMRLLWELGGARIKHQGRE
jgi:hypothetical protein